MNIPFRLPGNQKDLRVRLLALANSMAMAANVPARPWPLMKMALYLWGSMPTRPKRLPCSTAPKAAGGASHIVFSGAALGGRKTAAAAAYS